MEESRRQKQVASLINEEMNTIFVKLGLNIMMGGLVSISKVYVTPDLGEARIYISFFKVDDTATALQKIQDRAWEIKRELTAHIRNQLRIMPTLHFYIDDTLDYVFKMEEVFKKIQDQDAGTSPNENKE